ncbi:RHS repeat-associated core domain-containing protein [Streptomyces sp. NPDC005407]|uniref:RHS repeat-associated core domain-containing protein n=1 Tax=Streptomyces sp. NPDC005407 TaxID=3155340 RepID=UPI0033ADE176
MDTITGFTHIGARDYDPATGRFISVDPVMDLTNPQQMQGYSYANNTPVTSSDPSGLFCDGCSVGNPDTVWTPGNGPGCTHYACYDDDGNVDTSTPVKGGGGSAPPGAPPAQGQPTIGGVKILTPKEMAARGILTPFNTYQEAIHIWAVGLCQGSSAEDNGAFCKAANEVGLLDAEKPWVGVAIAVIGGCALAATACLRLAAETVENEIQVAAGGSLGAGATLAAFGSKLRGLYGRLGSESAQAAPGDTAALARLLDAPGALASKINADDLKMTRTVANHFNDITKDSRVARPYMRSTQVVREVMEGSAPKLDPQGAAAAVRWDTPGAMNGRSGTWELVVDANTNTIVHFNFVR